jgi:hypothetical protein
MFCDRSEVVHVGEVVDTGIPNLEVAAVAAVQATTTKILGLAPKIVGLAPSYRVVHCLLLGSATATSPRGPISSVVVA